MKPAVSLKGIGKKYRTVPKRSSRLKQTLFSGKIRRSNEFWALQDVNLDVPPGSTLGILGRNGAGKSTLLSIISGVLQPTTGEVEVNGRLAAIFGLGAGFNPLFTGRENAMLNGLLLGIDYEEMLERFDNIAAFADIGEFMDQPIRTYSSGMRSRLGFAVAVNVEPDILVLDEALSAGDAAFKKKSLQRMYELRDSGTTVLFVSHSMGMLKRFCTDAILLHKGRMVSSGPPEEVVDRYRELIEKSQGQTESSKEDQHLDYMIREEDEEDTPTSEDGPYSSSRKPYGSGTAAGEAEILNLELLNGNREPAESLLSGSSLTVRVHLRRTKDVEDNLLRITLHSRQAGLDVFSTDTTLEQVTHQRGSEGERATVDFTFEVPLQPGTYSVRAALLAPESESPHSYRAETTATLEIVTAENAHPVRGLLSLPIEVAIYTQDRRQEMPGRYA